jgi:hypothetical protein
MSSDEKKTKQFLIVGVVETDDPRMIETGASMTSFVERVLMLNSDGIINRCQMIAQTNDRVMSWGEDANKVFQLKPILPDSGRDPRDEMIEEAWELIANASHRPLPIGPRDATPGWKEAAMRWRDKYHAMIGVKPNGK